MCKGHSSDTTLIGCSDLSLWCLVFTLRTQGLDLAIDRCFRYMLIMNLQPPRLRYQLKKKELASCHSRIN
jgi:hypothetical protein